jgi:aldehyde dehydrogenase (NAD+)
MLSLVPLVASMTAGNTTIVKPSEFPAATSALMARIINSNFEPAYIHVVEGGIPETTSLLTRQFDKIFFTGSTKIGKIVYQAAAKHLTPVTLELGGKSPAIVTRDANVREAARRICWGKFLNAGQTCIAPDYVLVHESLRDEFLQQMVSFIEQYRYDTGNDNYVQIINDRNFERLAGMLEGQDVFYGGEMNMENRHIAPTILTAATFADAVMQEEIFGPILPVLTFTDLDQTIDQLKAMEKPLALYVFSNEKSDRKKIVTALSFGGGAINDTLMHISNPNLPFGGVGASGIGNYHDEAGFAAFTHYKSIQDKPLWFETNIKYPPYSKWKFRWLKYLLSK